MRARWIAAAGFAGYAAACAAGLRWGSTHEERRAVLPSDVLVPDPTVETNHAITIRGRREDVWPWLLQMGWQPRRVVHVPMGRPRALPRERAGSH